MRTKFYLVVGYGTLAVDAYLVLASIATRMMKSEYSQLLPPFGSDGGGEPSRVMVLLIATWTAILAMGCLRANNEQADKTPPVGTLWFVLVLAIVWLVFLSQVLEGLIGSG